MKLRSGKELGELPPKLTAIEKIDQKLECLLQEYKIATSGNNVHARELLNVISECTHSSDRFKVQDKMGEVYTGLSQPILLVGGLFSLITHEYPQYHEFIENKIKNFDLETSLIGDIEN